MPNGRSPKGGDADDAGALLVLLSLPLFTALVVWLLHLPAPVRGRDFIVSSAAAANGAVGLEAKAYDSSIIKCSYRSV